MIALTDQLEERLLNLERRVESLEAMLQATTTPAKARRKSTPSSARPAGCSGAIKVLIEEKYLDQLRTVAQVAEQLKIEGQPYTKELVSMNLLNLLKPPHRLLRRIKDNGQWKYIIRS